MTPALVDGPITVYLGDAREVLWQLPADSVHCVVTSTPYWGLRDYGTPPLTWGGDAKPDPEVYLALINVRRQLVEALEIVLRYEQAQAGLPDRPGPSCMR